MKVFRPLNIGITAFVGFVFWLITENMINSSIPDSVFLNCTYILLSCIVLAAANLINDHYDKDIDAINHTDKKFPFTVKTTWVIYLLFNILAIVFGSFVFDIEFVLIFLLLPIWGLWFYSFMLKRVAIIGNITIAILAIWLPLGFVMLNVQDLQLTVQESITGPAFVQFERYRNLIFLLLSCSFFSTFSREIVKDVQDEKGDKAMNCKTFPILVGKQFAIICAAILIVLTALIWGNFTFKNIDSLGYATIPFVVTFLLLLTGFLQCFQKSHGVYVQNGVVYLLKFPWFRHSFLVCFINEIQK